MDEIPQVIETVGVTQTLSDDMIFQAVLVVLFALGWLVGGQR